MPTIARIIAVTSGLSVAGSICGALSGATALAVAYFAVLRHLAPVGLLTVSGLIGAAFGAVAAPTLAWVLLRHVALGRALMSIACGSGVGGAIGMVVGANSVNPYVPLALNRPPVPQGLTGAAIGAVLATVLLRLSYLTLSRAPPANERWN